MDQPQVMDGGCSSFVAFCVCCSLADGHELTCLLQVLVLCLEEGGNWRAGAALLGRSLKPTRIPSWFSWGLECPSFCFEGSSLVTECNPLLLPQSQYCPCFSDEIAGAGRCRWIFDPRFQGGCEKYCMSHGCRASNPVSKAQVERAGRCP